MKITIFGTGYVGLVTGACLANLGHNVLCVDIDQQKIAQLQQGKIPFYESGLEELVRRMIQLSRLSFTTNPEQAIQFGEVIFNCVGTPGRENGSADLLAVFAVAETFGKYLDRYKILINKSTVPPGTARKSANIIAAQHPAFPFAVVSNPEFLKEGAAIHDFDHPDKIVIGVSDPEQSAVVFNVMERVYSGRERNYLPVVKTDWETAEMIKYAQNAFLATKITFANELANISELLGADVRQVIAALGMDHRINSKSMHPGVGYGGSCLPKDVQALIHIARQEGYDPALLTQVDQSNEFQKTRILRKIVQAYNGQLSGKILAVLGLSFKPETSDMREAPAIPIIQGLLERGAVIQAYDPIAREEAKKIFPSLLLSSSLSEALSGADGLVLITEWGEFRSLDWERAKELLRGNKIFDGRNIWTPAIVKEAGFEYYGMGRQ